jgi:hypothetical protein
MVSSALLNEYSVRSTMVAVAASIAAAWPEKLTGTGKERGQQQVCRLDVPPVAPWR